MSETEYIKITKLSIKQLKNSSMTFPIPVTLFVTSRQEDPVTPALRLFAWRDSSAAVKTTSLWNSLVFVWDGEAQLSSNAISYVIVLTPL